ncbi:MAG: hypothetical protein Kow00114_28520 [Kiloniellaceae bacterium]
MTEPAPGILGRILDLLRSGGRSQGPAAALPMERLVLTEDTLGHVGLELTELPNCESFERYAETLLRQLDGRVLKARKIVDMHLWDVEIDSIPLRLVYEDFPNRICLESASDAGDRLLRKLRRRLLSVPGRQESGPP